MNRYTVDNRRDFAAAATVSIASGQTTSGVITQGNATLAALLVPAGFTGTSVSFSGSIDGVNFFPLQDSSGVAATAVVAAGAMVTLDMSAVAPPPYLQIVAGSAQGSTVSIGLIFWN